MAADVVVSRELKSLQDEISAAQRERSTAPAPSVKAAARPEEAPAEPELRDQLRELSSEVTSFFEDAEKGIAAHPTQSVVGGCRDFPVLMLWHPIESVVSLTLVLVAFFIAEGIF
jgi:hypothetical protein